MANWKSIYQFTRHFFRAAAQISLHKMYTFVYRTFIKFILFCRGQARMLTQKPRFYAVSRAYFCRYLSEYSDRSSFSCMFTIWTYLTRQIFPNPEFTIAQNYSSVILFFHQNYRRTHSLILSLAPVRNILRQHLHPLHMDYNEVIAYGMLVDL